MSLTTVDDGIGMQDWMASFDLDSKKGRAKAKTSAQRRGFPLLEKIKLCGKIAVYCQKHREQCWWRS